MLGFGGTCYPLNTPLVINEAETILVLSVHVWHCHSVWWLRHVIDSLRALDLNLMKIFFLIIIILMIQSVHKFAHAMTAELSWHVQNYDQITSLFFMQEQHVFLKDLNFEFINCLWNVSLDIQWTEKGGTDMAAHTPDQCCPTLSPPSNGDHYDWPPKCKSL